MRHGEPIRHVTAAVCILSACALSTAHAEYQPSPQAPTIPEVTLVLPPDIGYIVETHPPAQPSAPTLIYIQEAHANDEVQQRIVSLLEQLIRQQGLELILVEGGHGDVGLSYLRGYGLPRQRKQVADRYLKAGLVTAEEYLDIVSEYPLTLWGVEEPELYQQQIDTFLDTEPIRERLRPILRELRETAESVKPGLADPAAAELDAKTAAFDAQALGLAEYADHLAGLMDRLGIDNAPYPNFKRLRLARQLERAINPERIPSERQALIAQLGRVAGEETLRSLIERAEQMDAGRLSPEAFYLELKALAARCGISLAGAPNLSRYVLFLKRQAQIEPAALAVELDLVVEALHEALASTPGRRQLRRALRQLDLLEKLVDLTWSPQDYQRFQPADAASLGSEGARFLSDELLRQGLPPRDFSRAGELAPALPALVRFYEVARARDEALVRNALAKVEASREPIAALIAGGFHARQMTRMFVDRGVGLVVVAPKVDQPTDERLYRAVLKYKSGHGSLQEVMALAEPSRVAEPAR